LYSNGALLTLQFELSPQQIASFGWKWHNNPCSNSMVYFVGIRWQYSENLGKHLQARFKKIRQAFAGAF
jgi:hypothetical protein